MCFQERDVPSDSLRGPPGRFGTLLGKETSAILQAARGAFRDDYSWQSGSSVSPSLPQAFNQSRSSSPVRCRPVSCKAVQDASASSLKLSRASSRSTYVRIRSEEHTSELQSLMRISYAVFCLKKKK